MITTTATAAASRSVEFKLLTRWIARQMYEASTERYLSPADEGGAIIPEGELDYIMFVGISPSRLDLRVGGGVRKDGGTRSYVHLSLSYHYLTSAVITQLIKDIPALYPVATMLSYLGIYVRAWAYRHLYALWNSYRYFSKGKLPATLYIIAKRVETQKRS